MKLRRGTEGKAEIRNEERTEVQSRLVSKRGSLPNCPESLRAPVLAPTLTSLSPLLQGFSEKASLPYSVLQPPQSCVKLEFFLFQVEGHWQVAELCRRNRCQEVRNSAHPSTAQPPLCPAEKEIDHFLFWLSSPLWMFL